MKSYAWIGMVLGLGLMLTACGSSDEEGQGGGGNAGQAGAAGTGGSSAVGGGSGGGTAGQAGAGATAGAAGEATGGAAGEAGTGGSGGGNSCFGGGDPCGDCAAEHCCPELSACAEDGACQSATICLATCDDSFENCAASCNQDANATFEAYSACLGDNGCGPSCVNLF